MSISKAKQQQFPAAGLDQWLETAEKSLKGKSVQSLKRETYEGIVLSPLYTKEESPGNLDQVPGAGQFIRGFRNEGQKWKVVQMRENRSWDDLVASIQDGLERGEEAIAFDGDLIDAEKAVFTRFAQAACPLFVTANSQFPLLAEKLAAAKEFKPHGVFASHFLSSRLGEGLLPQSGSRSWEVWQAALADLDRHAPRLKTIMVSSKPYASAGANAVQELAAALAEAVFYIEESRSLGWEPEKTAGKLVFHFAAGSQFFLEVAKFRAVRKLWTLVAKAYGVDPAIVEVSAGTSQYTHSILDPHVNMLRAGSAAFAAVIGGIDYLHVSPYDDLFKEEHSFSLRIARNTQLLLREESYLDKVADPAGGSNFVEALTEELAEKAWELFLKIDDAGGIRKVLETGNLQEWIAATSMKREQDVELRKRTLIGVNEFARIEEDIQPARQLSSAWNGEDGWTKVEPLNGQRLAEQFEALRLKADDWRRNGNEPAAGLILLGKLKDYKPRADFVTGVLAAGGIRADWSSDCLTGEDIREFVSTHPSGYYCLCGTDDAYRDMAEEAIRLIREEAPGSIVDLAGKIDLPEAGNDGAIFAGQNIAEKLSELQKTIGGVRP